MSRPARQPQRKSVVQLAFELMAAEERKQKRGAKKEQEPAEPVKNTRKGKAK